MASFGEVKSRTLRLHFLALIISCPKNGAHMSIFRHMFFGHNQAIIRPIIRPISIKGKVKDVRGVPEMAAAQVPLRGLGHSSSMGNGQRLSKTNSLTDKIGQVATLGYRIKTLK